MIDCTVREYAERDRAEVVALWNRVFADDPPRNAPERVIERKLGTQRELFLVAHVDGQVVGTVLGGYDGFRGWVYHLAVASEHRRAGIGRALMQQIEGGCAPSAAPRSTSRSARTTATCARSTSGSDGPARPTSAWARS
jgi:ribosomal protein S18 acetylase RimI-like enzyme